MSKHAVIALDAMGGDHAPESVLRGADMAAERFPSLHWLICGDQGRIGPFPLTASGFSKFNGTDLQRICYQAPIRFKAEKRKNKIDGCVAKRFFIS